MIGKNGVLQKKVISILAVCCIGLIIIGMITGGGSPDKNTSPINDGNNNVEQITGKQVKIIYDGEWSGAAGDVSSINSISGSGDETIDMPDDASLISANAQKKDGSSNELIIQILKDGKVVKESSTTAEYGVAQVSASV